MNSEERCQQIADKLLAKYAHTGEFTYKTLLTCLSDVYNVPAEPESINPFCDGLQLGLMLSATQPTTAGGLLEAIASMKENDAEMLVYTTIAAMLYERIHAAK